MKKQFERLWYLASDQLAEEHPGRIAPENITELERQRFAELIVGECLDIVANADITELEGPDPEDVLYVACKQVKQYFGVE